MFGNVYVYAAAGAIALGAVTAHVVEVNTLKRQVAEEREANGQLRSSLDVQNRAVEGLRASGAAARAEAAQALAQAKAVSSSHRGTVDALQGRILASKGSCAPALAEIRGMLK